MGPKLHDCGWLDELCHSWSRSNLCGGRCARSGTRMKLDQFGKYQMEWQTPPSRELRTILDQFWSCARIRLENKQHLIYLAIMMHCKHKFLVLKNMRTWLTWLLRDIISGKYESTDDSRADCHICPNFQTYATHRPDCDLCKKDPHTCHTCSELKRTRRKVCAYIYT